MGMEMQESTSSPRRAWRALRWLAGLVALGLTVYFLKFRPVPVRGFELHPGPFRSEVMGTGTLEARVKTTISPRLQERLAEVLVDQGDTVKAGQLLARLDDGELRRQVAVAEAALDAAQAMVERVRVDEARAEAVEQQARRDHQRVAELLATRVSSQADLDKAAELLSVAEADLRRAHAASREAESQRVTSERTLTYQQERLGFTRIVSPYDGLVVRRDRDPGGVVVPGSSLMQLISTDELWISAWVDESAMATLATGQVARVLFRSEPAREYPGRVVRLGREADRETREILVDVRVTELPMNWVTGQRAEVFIETGSRLEALTLPQGMLLWKQGRPGVFVNAAGYAAWRELRVGASGRGVVEVLEGLSAGDTVIQPEKAERALAAGRRIRRVAPRAELIPHGAQQGRAGTPLPADPARKGLRALPWKDRFMVSAPGLGAKGTSDEPVPKSGDESPHSRRFAAPDVPWSGAKRLECVRFSGAFWFMATEQVQMEQDTLL